MDQIRIILHIDMDAFYASVEIKDNQELKDLPVVVGIGPNIDNYKGVVSTASYKAREFGIKSGIPLSQAYNKNKDIIVLPARITYYREVSNRIMKILKSYADKFQQISIDEAFIDVSERIKNYDNLIDLINEIKNEIYEKEKLTCSVGAGPNKSVAKIASGFDKPSGITIVKPDEVDKFLNPLPVQKIPGVGKKTRKLLEKNGIKIIEDIKNTSRAKIISLLGKSGAKIYDIATGNDKSEVKPKGPRKSIGFIRSFEIAVHDVTKVYQKIEKLSKLIIKKLRRDGFQFKTVTIVIRYDDFSHITRSSTLGSYIKDYKVLVENAKELFDKEYKGEKRKIKRIGVRVSNLTKSKIKQETLSEYFK